VHVFLHPDKAIQHKKVESRNYRSDAADIHTTVNNEHIAQRYIIQESRQLKYYIDNIKTLSSPVRTVKTQGLRLLSDGQIQVRVSVYGP